MIGRANKDKGNNIVAKVTPLLTPMSDVPAMRVDQK